MKTNSNVWPYVIVGSAIGGAAGYLFLTKSGTKIRRTISNPDEIADNLDDVRQFFERKARVVTDQVHGVINKAQRGITEGERAYRQAEQEYQAQVHKLDSKSNEIASNVHNTVDKVSRTAVNIEHSVLDPIGELIALCRGVDRGVRALLGKSGGRSRDEGPVPIRDQRSMGW
jgi:gas vesicle protein